MEEATISQIKNQLCAYLQKVRAGETVLILDRKEPVARLERVEAGAEDRLARLERQSLVKRGTQPVPMELFLTPGPEPKRSVLEALLEERREGR